jgi:hypothetical protein
MPTGAVENVNVHKPAAKKFAPVVAGGVCTGGKEGRGEREGVKE